MLTDFQCTFILFYLCFPNVFIFLNVNGLGTSAKNITCPCPSAIEKQYKSNTRFSDHMPYLVFYLFNAFPMIKD